MVKHYPEPIVGAFIFNKVGKLFLMKSHKWKGNYVIPGGHIEVGEKMDETLKRECKEETNLDVFSPMFICFWEYIDDGSFHTQKHMIFFNFSCKTGDVSNITLNDEAEEYGWFSLQEALQLPLEKYVRRTIEEFLMQ